MPFQGNKRVLGVVEDLIFVVKIQDAAKRSGLESKFVKTEDDAIAEAAEKPLLVIVDLNANAVDPVALITKLKNGEKKLPVIAFVSHVQGELKQRAQEAGADMVMARSAFSTNLPQIFKRYSGSY